MNKLDLLVCVLAAGSALAQNVATFPSDHATIANGRAGIYWFPFSNGVSRAMAVYESWDVTVPAGRQITRLGFRADGTRQSPGKSVHLEVRIGRTDRNRTNLQSNFDANYFEPPTTVFGPAAFTLPDLNLATQVTQFWVDLTTPYTFDPSKNLLVEWRILANTNGGAAFNYWLDAADFESPIVTGPAGCAHSGGQTPTLLSRRAQVGGTWYCDLRDAPASQLVLWFVSLSRPLTSPYPLTPLLPGISPLCTGQVSPANLFSFAATTNAQGNHFFNVQVPNDRRLNDTILSSQVLCNDFFSPGGMVVSNGDQIQLGIDPATAVVYHQGSATNATGTVNQNYNVITLFGHN